MDDEMGLDIAVALALERLRVDYEIDVSSKSEHELAEGVLQVDMQTCVRAMRMAPDGDYSVARDIVSKSVARVIKGVAV